MKRFYLPGLAVTFAVVFLLVVLPTQSLGIPVGKTQKAAGADSLRRAADMCFAEHRYARADSLYRIILGADSKNAAVTALLASCVMRTGGFVEAVKLYHRALSLDPSLRLCHLGLVTCYYKLGEFELATVWAARVREELSGVERRDWDNLVREMFPLIAKDGE